MGKDLKGRELGKGLYQQQDGLYRAYFVDKFGKRQTKRSKKLQELRQWLSDAIYYDEHSDLENGVLVNQKVNQVIEEALNILLNQKEKNKQIEEIQPEWEDTVFLCRKGTPIKNSTYDTALFKICDKVGIDRFSMHVLRHTFGTRCFEGGMKPKTIQKIMGHSNIGITMNLYVHVTEDEKIKEIELVADALKVC